MRTYPDGDIRRRILIIAFILLGWFFVVFLRLIELQVVEHGRLKAEALEQNQDKITIQPKRGTLFDFTWPTPKKKGRSSCSSPCSFRRVRSRWASIPWITQRTRRMLPFSSRGHLPEDNLL